jgi:hypothetical protein
MLERVLEEVPSFILLLESFFLSFEFDKVPFYAGELSLFLNSCAFFSSSS